jgi:hypothetical protein
VVGPAATPSLDGVYGAVCVPPGLVIVAVLAGVAPPVLPADDLTSYADLLGLLVWPPVSALIDASAALLILVVVWSRPSASGLAHAVRGGAASRSDDGGARRRPTASSRSTPPA